MKSQGPNPRRIRLLVYDIDGCLSRGSTTPFSQELLLRLAEANDRSREDPDVPAITFCTGRPQPYVECLIQATSGYMPALCEGGTVFFDPVTHAVTMHRDFGVREQDLLASLRAEVARELVCEQVMFEPGKVTHLTLLVTPPYKPEEFLPAAEKIAARHGGEFDVECTRICVHFVFRHLHKGTGIEWLAKNAGIELGEMAGMGDARPDISFLRLVNLACAPANADDDVKAICGYVSEKRDAGAALDFLGHVIERNRAIPKERA